MDNRLLIIATQIMVIAIILSVTLLFIGFGVLVVLHICVVGRAFRRGLSTVSAGERCRRDGREGLPLEDIERLPSFYEFDSEGNGGCAVCLDGFQKGDRCRLLPLCGHSFHAVCVDPWLMRTPICPLCRATVCHRNRLSSGFQ